ncbi:MAG TPA: hypothetical protein DCZ95_17845 [Verrucomicrobia bacterium]|nr:MAG: hypothetical protein A2X46_07530 [Lentisphaerae bacterium GWF2_57_35]HBA85950.1 hypothetical protein [Verrucomicrobiota bacterium]
MKWMSIAGMVLFGGFAAHANLLHNTSFEDAGSTVDEAHYWQWANPDVHGAKWGNAVRKDWHAKSGSWCGTVCGSWFGDVQGGWWQEVPATPGVAYTFSGWFWADSNWTNQADQGIKIEFYSRNESGETMLCDSRNLFEGIGESWAQKTVSAVAPTNAQWVRVVVWAQQVGVSGALQFDDVSLVAEPGTVITLSSVPGALFGMLLMGFAYRRWRGQPKG